MKKLRKTKRRVSGAWTRGGLEKRTKEMWHMPKRTNLEQMVGAMKILLDKKLDLNNKTWTSGRKETFNTEMGKRNLTQSGGPLSQQSRRTFEALLKYLGLIYLDNISDPPMLRVTKGGGFLATNPTEALKLQMLKLQITNPVIGEDCQNILVFPFRVTLRLLIDLGYLTYDEIGYILFMKMKKQSDYEDIKNLILQFRNKSSGEKKKIIDDFKKTPEGKVTLAKAPSVGYFISLCEDTGLCERDSKKHIIQLVQGKEEEIRKLLKEFENYEAFDFGDNLDLWINYYGDVERKCPPKLFTIKFRCE